MILLITRFKDDNINHFLNIDVHSVARELQRETRKETGLLLAWHDESLPAARWRLGLFARLLGRGNVFSRIEDVPWDRVESMREIPEASWLPGGPMVDPFLFACPPASPASKRLFREIARRGSDAEQVRLDGGRRIILFIARKASRVLIDAATGLPLERVFGSRLAASDAGRLVITSFANMTFDEQASLMARADIIVGAHGAALTNLIFARPFSCQVFEVSLRRLWRCHPMCEPHLSGTLKPHRPCASASPAYAKADYRNLAAAFGIRHTEVEAVEGGRFENANHVSVDRLVVRFVGGTDPRLWFPDTFRGEGAPL